MLFARRKRADPKELRQNLARLLIDLKQFLRWVVLSRKRLEERIKRYEERLMVTENPNLKASYAQEIASLKSLITRLTQIEVAVEILVLRIETVLTAKLLSYIAPVAKLAAEVLRDLRENADELSEFTVVLDDLAQNAAEISSKGMYLSNNEVSVSTSKEAEKILEMAKKAAEAKAEGVMQQ